MKQHTWPSRLSRLLPPTKHPLALGPLPKSLLCGRSDLLTFHPGDVGCRAGCRQAKQSGCLSLQQHLVLEFDVEDWGKVCRESTDSLPGLGCRDPVLLTTKEGEVHVRAGAEGREQNERLSLR